MNTLERWAVKQLNREKQLDFDVFEDAKPPQRTIYDNVLDVRTEENKQLNMDDNRGKTPTFEDIFE